MNSVILATTTRLLASLMLLFAMFLFLRGHDAPGGGFAAALVAATAFALHALAFGPDQTRKVLRVQPRVLAVAGLGMILVSTLLGPLTGQSPLTGVWLEWGSVKLGSPILFDLGVFLAVLAGVVGAVLALEEEEQADQANRDIAPSTQPAPSDMEIGSGDKT